MGVHERGHLVTETDRRSADQLPRPCHPDQEAHDHENRDPPRGTSVARADEQLHAEHKLKHERPQQPDQERGIPRGDLLHAADPSERQQGSRHEEQSEQADDERRPA